MNITKAISVPIVCLLMSSCYSSHINVGKMTHDHPVRTVGVKKNHYLFGGLIPLSRKQNARDYVGDAKHYKIRTSHKFIDVLITSLTGTIYSPITVTYYMSEVDANQRYQKQRDMFDEEDDEFENRNSFGDEDDFIDFDKPAKSPIKQVEKEKKKTTKKTEPQPKKEKAPVVKETPTNDDEQVPSIEQLRRRIEEDRKRHEQRIKEIEALKRKIKE